jgi:hypothetical protein
MMATDDRNGAPRPGVAASLYPTLPNGDAAAAEFKLRQVLPKYRPGPNQAAGLRALLNGDVIYQNGGWKRKDG